VSFRTPYAGYDVLAKWNSPSFDETTREVLRRRLAKVPPRRFLAAEEWLLLEAVCARLIPQPEREPPIPIVPWIDAALHENRGEGFRFEDAPPMRQAWRQGLKGVAREAERRFGRPFESLTAEDQDTVLRAVQAGEVEPDAWEGLAPQRFFCDLLLKTAAGVYYAHPAAWSEIGFGGPASPRGYVRLGMDGLGIDPWDGRETGDAGA
jgi:hypothetical protein